MPSHAAALPDRRRLARGPLARVLAGLFLLLHVFTVAALPVADGLADHSDAVVVHIEDAEGGHCPASHHASCDLCQFAHGLRAVASDAGAYGIPAVSRQSLPPVDALTLPGGLAFLDGNASRAPPALG